MADEHDLEEYKKNNPDSQATLEDGKIVVSAAGSAVHTGPNRGDLGKRLEAAAVAAVNAAMEDGVPLNESSTILLYKSNFRAVVLDAAHAPKLEELRKHHRTRLKEQAEKDKARREEESRHLQPPAEQPQP